MNYKAVVFKSVSKKYPIVKARYKGGNLQDFWALKEVDIDIESGQAVGIIGRNGAGKTTLLNIAAGVLSPTRGEVLVNGKIIGLFNLGAGFQDELSGRENIFLNGAILGADRKEIEAKIDSIVDFSELGNFINMPLGSYSQGMRLRLGFSIIANLDFDVLVIDEVLAVGDALFQNKCFERLLDFKRMGRTLILTTQGMDLVERLCDKVAVLDHGSLLFNGNVLEGINRYRSLLNAEKFFVGLPQQEKPVLIEDTKKWADNVSDWGKKFGGKEVLIENVEFIDKFENKIDRVKTGDFLKIKVSFAAKTAVKDVHFGIAIFRNDGVYCYGPNTGFDGYVISELKKGGGYFDLSYDKLLLAPGEYRISVAIWDKNETLAFDYHYGYYKLTVSGQDNKNKELINMPLRAGVPGLLNRLASFLKVEKKCLCLNPDLLADKFCQVKNDSELEIKYFNFLDAGGNKKDIFTTNEKVIFSACLNLKKKLSGRAYLWAGIYRDDGVYCQGVTVDLRVLSHKAINCRKAIIMFPEFSLLPGRYKILIGVWDSQNMEFLKYCHGSYPLKMVSDKRDHGTVFLKHKWGWTGGME